LTGFAYNGAFLLFFVPLHAERRLITHEMSQQAHFACVSRALLGLEENIISSASLLITFFLFEDE